MIFTIIWYYLMIGVGFAFIKIVDPVTSKTTIEYMKTIIFKDIGIDNNKTKQSLFVLLVIIFQVIFWPLAFKNNH